MKWYLIVLWSEEVEKCSIEEFVRVHIEASQSQRKKFIYFGWIDLFEYSRVRLPSCKFRGNEFTSFKQKPINCLVTISFNFAFCMTVQINSAKKEG